MKFGSLRKPSCLLNNSPEYRRVAPSIWKSIHNIITNTTKFLHYVFRFGLPEPIYVNLLRDPVERVISWYYYVRAPWYYVERKQAVPDIPLPDPQWLKKVKLHLILFILLDKLKHRVRK